MLRRTEYRCSSKVTIFVFAVAARGRVFRFGPHSECLAELLEEDSPECEAHLVTAALEFLRFVYTKPVATHQLTV